MNDSNGKCRFSGSDSSKTLWRIFKKICTTHSRVGKPTMLCERTVGISSQHISTGRGRRSIRIRHKFVPRLVRRNRVLRHLTQLLQRLGFHPFWDSTSVSTSLVTHLEVPGPIFADAVVDAAAQFSRNTAYGSVCVHAKTVVPPRSVTCSITPVVVPPPAPYRTMSTAETVPSVPQGHPIVNPTNRRERRVSHSSEPRDSSSRHPPRRRNRHERCSATDSLRSDDVEPYTRLHAAATSKERTSSSRCWWRQL